MRNRYPDVCYRCSKPVEKGQGHFERITYQHKGKPETAPKWYPGAPKWRTQHAECCIKAREERAGASP